MRKALRVLMAVIIGILLESAAHAAGGFESAVSPREQSAAIGPAAAPPDSATSAGRPAPRSRLHPASQDRLQRRTGGDSAAALRRALNSPAQRRPTGHTARRPSQAAAATPGASSAAHLEDASRPARMARPPGGRASLESHAALPGSNRALALGQRPPALVTLGGPARLRPSPGWEPQPRYAIRH